MRDLQDGQSAGASCRQQEPTPARSPSSDSHGGDTATIAPLAGPATGTARLGQNYAWRGEETVFVWDSVLHISGAAQAEASVPRPNHWKKHSLEGSGPRLTLAHPARGSLQELSAKFETRRRS